MKKKQTKAQKTNYQKYYPLVIFISILFMSVGYAVINSTKTIAGITVAVNEAISNAIKTSEEEMGAITSGLNMPGLF